MRKLDLEGFISLLLIVYVCLLVNVQHLIFELDIIHILYSQRKMFGLWAKGLIVRVLVVTDWYSILHVSLFIVLIF